MVGIVAVWRRSLGGGHTRTSLLPCDICDSGFSVCPPLRPELSTGALTILLLFLKLQPNLLKPFSLMTNLTMARWELQKGTTTSSLVASVR